MMIQWIISKIETAKLGNRENLALKRGWLQMFHAWPIMC